MANARPSGLASSRSRRFSARINPPSTLSQLALPKKASYSKPGGHCDAQARFRRSRPLLVDLGTRRASEARRHHRLYHGCSQPPSPTRRFIALRRAAGSRDSCSLLQLPERLVSSRGQRALRLPPAALALTRAQRLVRRGPRVHELAGQSRPLADPRTG